MRTNIYVILIACSGLLGGCAATVTVPRELVDAREAFERANTGIATLMAPGELRVAHLAMIEAEQSFRERPDSYQTRDLAYIAERKSRMAEISAAINIERGRQIGANDEYRRAGGEVDAKVEASLNGAKEPLTTRESEQRDEMIGAQLSAFHEARTAKDQRAFESTADLARLVELKQELRGIVIVLPASALFAPGQPTLLPEARSLLDPVIEVLLSILERKRNLIINGHTDSQGLGSDNVDFSQRRANAVRDYLVQRDYPSDRIDSRGLGEEHPIADNATAEGRAKNRRVEIIIEGESPVSNKTDKN